MTGRNTDLKIISFTIHHWDFLKKNNNEKNCLSVWNGGAGKAFYDDSEVYSGNLEVHLLCTMELQG